MSIQSGQVVTATFTTRRVDTGAGANADSLPSGTLYINGTASGSTVTVTNVTTGLYKASVTLPTLSIGDEAEIVVSVTVNGVSDKAKVWRDNCGVAFDDAGRVQLASNALDGISVDAPTGVAGNFREMVVQIWRRFFAKATKSSAQLITYADDGTTVITTQAISDDDILETQGAAS